MQEQDSYKGSDDRYHYNTDMDIISPVSLDYKRCLPEEMK
jgi:hypothetical protein